MDYILVTISVIWHAMREMTSVKLDLTDFEMN